MADNADEQWPDLPPNATREQVIQRGRDLQRAYTEHKEKLRELENSFEEAVERAERDGGARTEEGASLIAQLKEDLAAMKVLQASWGEVHEHGREIAQRKGYDV